MNQTLWYYSCHYAWPTFFPETSVRAYASDTGNDVSVSSWH